MKKHLYGIMGMLIILNVPALANQPTDIRFASKHMTFFGERYSVYVVRCSDGSKVKISSWNNGKRWCVGTNQDDCSDGRNAQMEIAKKVCR